MPAASIGNARADGQESARPELNELERLLEAETGFTCYREYLKFCQTSYPGVYDRSTLKDSPNIRNDAGFWDDWTSLDSSCSILDLSMSEVSPDLSNIIEHRFLPHERSMGRHDKPPISININRSTAVKLFRQLRSPLGDNKIRIVCWSTRSKDRLLLDILDVLGLGLGINPGFFDALESRRRKSPIRSELTCRRSDLVIIGEAVATVNPPNSAVAPIIIIAGDLGPYGHVELGGWPHGDEELENGCATQHEPVILPFPSRKLASQRDSAPQLRQNEVTKSKRFFRAFARFLEADHSTAPCAERIFMASLVPLIKSNTLDLGTYYIRSRKSLTGTFYAGDDESTHSRIYDDLHFIRGRLRRAVESSEDSVDTLNNYGRCVTKEKCLQNQIYLNVIENWQATIARARRLESEMRDFMQLKIGDLSIVESRKSIHLANLQMQEGKRGEFDMS